MDRQNTPAVGVRRPPRGERAKKKKIRNKKNLFWFVSHTTPTGLETDGRVPGCTPETDLLSAVTFCGWIIKKINNDNRTNRDNPPGLPRKLARVRVERFFFFYALESIRYKSSLSNKTRVILGNNRSYNYSFRRWKKKKKPYKTPSNRTLSNTFKFLFTENDGDSSPSRSTYL